MPWQWEGVQLLPLLKSGQVVLKAWAGRTYFSASLGGMVDVGLLLAMVLKEQVN